jgi:hypothetical protein
MSDPNKWLATGPNILSPANLDAIRTVLDDVGPIVVEHWFYYGSRSPDRVVFDDYEDFLEYLTHKTKPGDAIHVWSFAAVCSDKNSLTHGKVPDSEGRVPENGAY